jgi:hypothetical protein
VVEEVEFYFLSIYNRIILSTPCLGKVTGGIMAYFGENGYPSLSLHMSP